MRFEGLGAIILSMQTGESLKAQKTLTTRVWPKISEVLEKIPGVEIAVLMAFFLLTVLLTWPLLINFTTNVPNGPPEDRFQNFWNFWWVKESLGRFHNPYNTNFLFYPYFNGVQNPTIPLYLHTLQLFNCLAALPFTLTLGVGAAYNAVVFLAFSLSGLGAFLLARHLTRNFWAGFLAGIIYTFSLSHFGSLQTSITNIISIEWLPFYALSLQFWYEKRSKRWAVLAGVFLALAVFTDWYNTIFLLFYTFFFYVAIAFPRRWLRQASGVALALGVGGLLGSFVIIPAFITLRSPIFAAQLDSNRDIRSSATLVDLLSPFTFDGLLFWLGLITGVALFASRSKFRRPALFWLSFFLLSSLFTLGPRLQFQRSGDPDPTGIPLPYSLIKLIPGASVMRSPDRFDIPGRLALAVIVALGFCWLATFLAKRFSRLPSGRISPGLFLALGLPYLLAVNPAPLPLVAVNPDPFVNSLPKTGNYSLLELPITRHYNFDHERMLNQIYHRQPIMGGYLSRPVRDPYREPGSPFRYLADQAYLYGVNPSQEIFPALNSSASVDNLLKLFNFQYVVLYKNDYKFEKERQSIRELIEQRLGKNAVIQEDTTTLLYQVPARIFENPTPTPSLFLGEGWYQPEENKDGFYRWANQAAEINVTVSRAGRFELSFTVQSFGANRPFAVTAGGRKFYEATLDLAPHLVKIELDLPPGTTSLRLESLTPATTALETGQGQDKRPLAFLVRSIIINNL